MKQLAWPLLDFGLLTRALQALPVPRVKTEVITPSNATLSFPQYGRPPKSLSDTVAPSLLRDSVQLCMDSRAETWKDMDKDMNLLTLVTRSPPSTTLQSSTGGWTRAEDVTDFRHFNLRWSLLTRKSSLTPSPRKSTQRKALMEREGCWLPPLCSWDARLGDPVEEFQPSAVRSLQGRRFRSFSPPAWLPPMSFLSQPLDPKCLASVCIHAAEVSRRAVPEANALSPAWVGQVLPAAFTFGCRKPARLQCARAWNNDW